MPTFTAPPEQARLPDPYRAEAGVVQALAARLGGVTLATSSIRDKELGVLGRIAKATEQTAQVVRAAKSAGDGGSGGVAVFAP